MERVLVTGCAGFIGMHLCKKLLKEGRAVYGIDNLNDYYSPVFKEDRLKKLNKHKNFNFKLADITDSNILSKIFKSFKPEKVVNLAAQAGVRYSLINPHEYIMSNISGFLNVIECCRKFSVEGLIYASSSSVYGDSKKTIFSEVDRVSTPISVYAASKISNELLAYSYSRLYNLKTTGLRFFTVYGPWGRPDMAMYIFTNKILKNKPIVVFNNGNMKRDFTYIDDIIDGVISSLNHCYSYEVFNLGRGKSIDLLEMIRHIENNLNKKANIEYDEIQPGDVPASLADISRSKHKLGYQPNINLEEGIVNFIEWYKKYNFH